LVSDTVSGVFGFEISITIREFGYKEMYAYFPTTCRPAGPVTLDEDTTDGEVGLETSMMENLLDDQDIE
jgi:hypothetical protein